MAASTTRTGRVRVIEVPQSFIKRADIKFAPRRIHFVDYRCYVHPIDGNIVVPDRKRTHLPTSGA